MLKVILPDRVIGIRFSHPLDVITKRRTTACFILSIHGGDRVLMSTGVTYCSIRDCFQKETGRKKALARALQPKGKHLFSRWERWKVWQVYHNRGKETVC